MSLTLVIHFTVVRMVQLLTVILLAMKVDSLLYGTVCLLTHISFINFESACW